MGNHSFIETEDADEDMDLYSKKPKEKKISKSRKNVYKELYYVIFCLEEKINEHVPADCIKNIFSYLPCCYYCDQPMVSSWDYYRDYPIHEICDQQLKNPLMCVICHKKCERSEGNYHPNCRKRWEKKNKILLSDLKVLEKGLYFHRPNRIHSLEKRKLFTYKEEERSIECYGVIILKNEDEQMNIKPELCEVTITDLSKNRRDITLKYGIETNNRVRVRSLNRPVKFQVELVDNILFLVANNDFYFFFHDLTLRKILRFLGGDRSTTVIQVKDETIQQENKFLQYLPKKLRDDRFSFLFNEQPSTIEARKIIFSKGAFLKNIYQLTELCHHELTGLGSRKFVYEDPFRRLDISFSKRYFSKILSSSILLKSKHLFFSSENRSIMSVGIVDEIYPRGENPFSPILVNPQSLENLVDDDDPKVSPIIHFNSFFLEWNRSEIIFPKKNIFGIAEIPSISYSERSISGREKYSSGATTFFEFEPRRGGGKRKMKNEKEKNHQKYISVNILAKDIIDLYNFNFTYSSRNEARNKLKNQRNSFDFVEDFYTLMIKNRTVQKNPPKYNIHPTINRKRRQLKFPFSNNIFYQNLRSQGTSRLIISFPKLYGRNKNLKLEDRIIEFKSHEDLDRFVLEELDNNVVCKPSTRRGTGQLRLENPVKDVMSLLFAFDQIFWGRHKLFPENKRYLPLGMGKKGTACVHCCCPFACEHFGHLRKRT